MTTLDDVREALNKLDMEHSIIGVSDNAEKYLKEALTLLSDYRAKEGWQDISTAPMGGTEILLLAGYKRWIGFWDVWKAGTGGGGGDDPNPTHWQPLPPPLALISDEKGA